MPRIAPGLLFYKFLLYLNFVLLAFKSMGVSWIRRAAAPCCWQKKKAAAIGRPGLLAAGVAS